MSTNYADPVDVQRRGDSPAAFCWRGRVFLVKGVLAHWLETGPWWQSASLRGLLAAKPRQREVGPKGRGTGKTPSAAESETGEREFWQVEAAPGRHAAPGVYELCVDWSSGEPGSWSVTTLDRGIS